MTPRWKSITFALAVSVFALGAGSWVLQAQTTQEKPLWHKRPSKQAVAPIKAYDFSPLVEKVQSAVFNITITSTMLSEHKGRRRRSPFRRGFPFFDEDGNPFGRKFRRHRRRIRPRPMRSSGTGFLINSKGYALTNHHVVRRGGKIVAQLADKREFKVKVIGKAPLLDIALIKLQAPKGTTFPYTYLGDSEKLKVGEPVIAIGNARALGLTVTAGIISARGRVIGSGNYDNYIQTDAAINRGNSGGPLFNRHGEVVGINTAILRRGRGIGFAIPINIAVQILPQLRKKGKVERAQLGVMVQHVNANLARTFGLARPRGALVARVVDGSPAARAGIKPGDIILKVNNRKVRNHNHLPLLVAFLQPGQKLNLTVLRNKKKRKLSVVLAKWGRPGTFLGSRPDDGDSDGQGQDKALDKLGLGVANLTDDLRQQHNLKSGLKGVVITGLKADGLAAQNGVRKGDLILEVNRTPIRSVKQLRAALAKLKAGDHVLLRLQRGDNAMFIAFPFS